MRNRRPIAILTCIFLLLGQFASAVHAVEHIYPEIPGSYLVFEHPGNKFPEFEQPGNKFPEHKHPGHEHEGQEHEGQEHEGQEHEGQEHFDFSVANQDDRPGERHGDLSCLVYHIHGSVQASLPTPIIVPVRNNTTEADAEVFTQIAIEATARRLVIRGPPIIS